MRAECALFRTKLKKKKKEQMSNSKRGVCKWKSEASQFRNDAKWMEVDFRRGNCGART